MRETNASLFSAVGLTALGTTCCALPITLVALGAGGAVASMASAAPWLIWLSQYKAWTFALTAAALAWSWWQVRRVDTCDIKDARRLAWQRRILWASTLLFGVSVVAAYGLILLME